MLSKNVFIKSGKIASMFYSFQIQFSIKSTSTDYNSKYVTVMVLERTCFNMLPFVNVYGLKWYNSWSDVLRKETF